MKTTPKYVGMAALGRPVERSSAAQSLPSSTVARCVLLALLAVFAAASGVAQDLPMFRWENFTTANGLPDNHVYSVLVDGNRIWAGTDNGLGLYENGKWKIFRPCRRSGASSCPLAGIG